MGLKIYSREDHLDPIRRYSIFNISDRNSFYNIHTHRNLYEIFLCVKGTAVHLINNHEQKINAYSITFIRSNDVHGFIDPIDDDFQIFNISIDKDVMEEAFVYLGTETAETILLKNAVAPNVIIPNLEFLVLKEKFEKMFVLSSFDMARIPLILRTIVISILNCFFSARDEMRDKNMPLWILRVINEIHRPECFIQGVNALYRIACKCPEHVCRELKKYLNKTPTEIVNEIRMENAARKLVHTDEKVIDICAQVGFDNLSHFYHWFKKIYGMSPLEFRRKTTRIDKF